MFRDKEHNILAELMFQLLSDANLLSFAYSQTKLSIIIKVVSLRLKLDIHHFQTRCILKAKYSKT